MSSNDGVLLDPDLSAPEPEHAAAPADQPVVSVRGVGKCYEIYSRPFDRLKQTLRRGKRQYYREFWALRDISFEVRRGEAMGIIGRNGSGKSTLLQIIAGTLRPTHGEVSVRGRVAALLELGSGFNPEFTGRENVYLNAAILGLSRQEVDDRFDAIADFADIGNFLDQPIKTYSTGMVVRLAFAVQVQVEPDILIVDEALSVGDSLFQKRCFQRIEELRTRGVTLLFVSHDQETVRTLTSRALLLEEGAAKAYGPSAEVVLEYRKLLHDAEKRYFEGMIHAKQQQRAAAPAVAAIAPSPHATPSTPESSNGEELKRSDAYSFGDLDAEIVGCTVLDTKGNAASVFHPGEQVVIRIAVSLNRSMNHLSVAFRLRNKEGVKLYSWGTFNQDMEIWAGRCEGDVFWEKSFVAGRVFAVDFEFPCCLGHNFYEVQAAVTEEHRKSYGSQRMLHWRDEAAFFHVHVRTDEHFFGGVCDLRAKACLSAVQPVDAESIT